MEHKKESKTDEFAHTEHLKSENSNTASTAASISNGSLDTYSYKGWLNSDKFLKRAMANVGYNVVGGLIVYAVIFIPIMLIALFIGIFAAMIGSGN